MYYAKPIEGKEGSYRYHIERSYKVMEQELIQVGNGLSSLLEKCDETQEQYVEKMKTAILMHDTGKLNPLFQSQMKRIIDNSRRSKKYYFRHELLSFYLMLPLAIKWQKEDKKNFPYPLFAVLSHHKDMTPKFESFQRDINKSNWPMLTPEEEAYAYSFLAQYKLPVPSEVIKNNQVSYLKMYMEHFFTLPGMEKRKVFDTCSRYEIRLLYGVAKGQLHYCDWVASSGIDFPPYILSQTQLIENLKQKVASENKIYQERPFHTLCGESFGDVIVIAPTGAGKTEASLRWAAQFEGKKIIFCMPTKVTSNSIYKRMQSHYFKPNVCGLSHSGAATYFAMQEDPPFELLHGKAFLPSVMICTVDQILTSGFNSKQWSLKEYALVNSVVIMDEIQSYDTFTLALITETIYKIKDLGGQVMLMSATFPKFLQKHFQKVLSIQAPIVAKELMDRCFRKWCYIDKDLGEIDCEINLHLSKGKKVALIVNDVETAKKEYDKWHNLYPTLCLHSQFMMKDRIEKEEILTDGSEEYQFVIATQVLEVSLDVSFEIMFSECAPIESLVQRAGRCNRYGEHQDSEFIVFNYSEISEKYVYRKAKSVLEKTKTIVQANQRRLSERDILKMIEEVYKEFDMYDENYEEGKAFYENIIDNNFIFDLPIDEKTVTRQFDMEKVSIIPVCVKEEVEQLFDDKEYSKIPLYEIPISYYRYKKIFSTRIEDSRYPLPVFCVDYSWEKGIEYQDKSYDIL